MCVENKIEKRRIGWQANARMREFLCLVLQVMLLCGGLCAQQLKIGDNYTKLDSSAALEIESQRLALLLPRIVDTNKVVTTVKDGSLLFYPASVAANRGMYVRSISKWEPVSPYGMAANWYTTGNAGTIGNQHFVGTTDARPLLLTTNNITRLFMDSTSSGYIGIGTQTPSGDLDNRGATILGAKILNSFSANTSLGSSVNTVDSFTTFIIPQTTIGVNITLPNPSRPVDGRIITVVNTGTAAFTVASFSLAVNDAISFIWASSQWRIVGDGAVNGGSFLLPNKYISPSTLGMMSGAAETTIAQDNIAVGQYSLGNNITGSRNIAIGNNAIRFGTTPFANVAVGVDALGTNPVGKRNTAIGYRSLYNNTADSNCAVGAFSLLANLSGKGNTAVGISALNTYTTGDGNTAVGTANFNNSGTDGRFNTATGLAAAQLVKSSYNTIMGSLSCTKLNAGANYNTTFGYLSGDNDGISGGTSSNQNVKNATALGVRAQFLQSNTIILGSEAASYVTNVGVGIYNPGFKLHIDGTIASQGTILTPSDLRFKNRIRPLENSLQKILALQGVTYRWNREATEKLQLHTDSLVHYGFIAQEVEAVLPNAVITASDSFQTKTIEYAALVPVVTAAVKEQQPQLQSLSRAQSDAGSQLEKMQAQINRILQAVHKQ